MGKVAHRPGANGANTRQVKARRLLKERKELSERLAKLDSQLARLRTERSHGALPTRDEVDRWLDELSDGLPNLPPLPADFSRADLYDDHD